MAKGKGREWFDVKLHEQCPDEFHVTAPVQKEDLKTHSQYAPNDDTLNLYGVPGTITAHLETKYKETPRKLRKPKKEVDNQYAYFSVAMGDPEMLAGPESQRHLFAAGAVATGLKHTLEQEQGRKKKYVMSRSASGPGEPATLKIYFVDRKTPIFEQFQELQDKLKNFERAQAAGHDALGVEAADEQFRKWMQEIRDEEQQSWRDKHRGGDGNGRGDDKRDDDGPRRF